MKFLCESCGELAEGAFRADPGGPAIVCSRCGAEQPVAAAPAAAAPALQEPPPDVPEEEAWALLLSRWEDEAAHEAYLARSADLEGLARAGRRYRDRLAGRPDDPAALRWREEILRRAAALGLALLPRTQPPRALAPRTRRVAVAVLVAAAAGAVVWMAARLLGPRGAP